MLARLAIAVAALAAALALAVSLQPSSFAVERSIEVAAPPEIVFAHIQDLRAMDAWSPFARMDPEMEIVYGGPAAGVGARSSWQGPRMGAGRLTITAVRAPEEVDMRLEMLSPVKADNRVVFSLAPSVDATRVRWRMEGENGFVGRAMGLFADMDEMVGGEFERGLASLKRVAESETVAAGR